MLSKARPPKRTQPAAAPPMEWERADPAALAAFDPASKTCTMNCGKHAHDPRSYKELKFMCDDCDCHEPKGTPAMTEQPKWITPYEHAAYLAHESVREVRVDIPAPGVVRLSVRSWSPEGPSDALLALVREAVEPVRAITVQVQVEALADE